MTLDNDSVDYLKALGIEQWRLRSLSPPLMLILDETEGDVVTHNNHAFFLSQTGLLLEAMLTSIRLLRTDLKLILTSSQDSQANLAWLNKQIALVRPKMLLVFGQLAAQHLLQNNFSLTRLRGHRWTFGTQQVPLIVTIHPFFLFRSPLYKAEAYVDLLSVQQRLFTFND